MRYRAGVTGVLLAAALAVSATEAGKCSHGGPEGPGGCLWKELGLNQEQREQLRELRLGQAESNKEFRARMREIRKATKEELAKDSPSKAVLEKLAGKIGDLADDLAKEKVEYLLQVKKILTKEQWAKLIERNWMLDLGPGTGPGCRPGPCKKRMKGNGNRGDPPECSHHEPPPDKHCPHANEGL